jgi:hypothetical protein
MDGIRSDFHDISPMHHFSESTTFDFPQPLGPTMHVMPGLSGILTLLAKDLNP